MAIVEMNKITLIGLNKDKERILQELMRAGVVEITDNDEKIRSDEWARLVAKDGDAEAVSELESSMEKVDSALNCLSRYDNRKKSLFENKRIVDENHFNRIVEDRDRLLSVAGEILKLNERLNNLKLDRNRNTNLIASLEPWKELDIPLELASTEYAVISIGVVPVKADIAQLREELYEQAAESHLDMLGQDSEQSYLLLIYHRDLDQIIKNVMKKYSFSKVSFKDLKGTASQNIAAITRIISDIDSACKDIESKIAAFVSEKDNLEVLYDYLVMQRDRKKALDSIIRTDRAFMLEGWIPMDLSEYVKNSLTAQWDLIVDIKKPGDDEEYPILLANRGLSEAVEPVTEMYSLPSRNELDPNKVMAPFFVLFFGLMLGDGGYGLIMTAFSGIVLWRLKLDDSMRKFAKLMLYCGLSTIFWGALFGGWFGIAALGEYPLWFNPVEDPEEMLRWSLLFGIIHIFAGIGVRGVNLIRKKKYIDVVFDVLLWYVFFTGFVLFVLPYAPKMDADSVAGLVDIGKYMLVVGGVLLILTQGRHQKNIFMKFISGISSLYDLIGFMSDVLSYSRLLALGLATSVIASIVNEMGAMGGLDNVFKILGFVLILLIGHSINLAINALGAYVHSSRLQYIEFFGKFYQGGGAPFRPLKINTKYINLMTRRS